MIRQTYVGLGLVQVNLPQKVFDRTKQSDSLYHFSCQLNQAICLYHMCLRSRVNKPFSHNLPFPGARQDTVFSPTLLRKPNKTNADLLGMLPKTYPTSITTQSYMHRLTVLWCEMIQNCYVITMIRASCVIEGFDVSFGVGRWRKEKIRKTV